MSLLQPLYLLAVLYFLWKCSERNVYIALCVCGVCVGVCVCVCGCVFVCVWVVLQCCLVLFSDVLCCNVWVCVCVGFVVCGCVYVWVL